MKSFAAAVLLLSAATVSQAKFDRQMSIDLLTKCKAQTGATEDPVTTFDTQSIPETKEGKCMLACALQEQKLMTPDGKVNAQAFSTYMEEKFKDDPEKLEDAARVVGICSTTIDSKGKDKCELAHELFTCGKKNGFSLN